MYRTVWTYFLSEPKATDTGLSGGLTGGDGWVGAAPSVLSGTAPGDGLLGRAGAPSENGKFI